MKRSWARGIVVAIVALCVGVASSAAVLASLPDPGSPPSVYDDFNWSSTANGFWHVNADGASERIKGGTLALSGDSIELDRRMQTDPSVTEVAVRIRGLHFHKFGFGLGIYHAGTVGIEFDDDGAKCGRGTDFGYRVDFLRGWTSPPTGQWYYLTLTVTNPYPTKEEQEKVANLDASQLKKVTLTCAMYDSTGKLLTKIVARDPAPNAHYQAFDEVYMRTWDSANRYQVDWFYAGPPSGAPPIGPRR